MAKVLRIAGQVITYGAFAAVIAYLSFQPPYNYAPSDVAAIKVSLSHATDRIKPCVRMTPEEIERLKNTNMRRTETCERQRLPLALEIDVDGESVLRLNADPSGLWGDGPASIYERFELPPGMHRITARLRDSARSDGWDYTHTEDVVLEAGRYHVITFRPETGGFAIR